VAREKSGSWSWEWHASRDPPPGQKPIDRIPFHRIQGISAVQSSTSEFAIKYKNRDKRVETMIMQRTDRPRDTWLQALSEMVRLVREARKLSNNAVESQVSRGSELLDAEEDFADDKSPVATATLTTRSAGRR